MTTAVDNKKYLWIWVVLVLGLFISFLLDKFLSLRHLAITLIFVVAAIKAYLVTAYYMQLHTEARYVKIMLWGGILCLLILFWVLVPDIVWVYGK